MSLQTAGIGRIRDDAPPMLIPNGNRATDKPDDAPRREHIRARPLNILEVQLWPNVKFEIWN